jgi:hypothetical protein
MTASGANPLIEGSKRKTGSLGPSMSEASLPAIGDNQPTLAQCYGRLVLTTGADAAAMKENAEPQAGRTAEQESS